MAGEPPDGARGRLMASDVIVPEVGELGMEVKFVRWLKEPGDEVAVGDPLFEVDTEKSVMVVEAYAAGTLADLSVDEGDTVAPRDVIGRILAPGERPAAAEPVAAASPPPVQAGGPSGTADSSSAAPAASPVPTEATAVARRGGVSPRARRMAKKLGVDTAILRGTGPDGLITEADVRAAAEIATGAGSGAAAPSVSAPAAPTAGGSTAASEDALARTRRAVAEATTTSWQTIPHFYLQLEADAERGLELAKPTALVCASVAQALLRHPECNLAWDGETPVRRQSVELGLLVDAPTGLLITVIEGAGDLDLADMADAIATAADRARAGRLSAVDLGPRSLTVSNLGMYAVDRFVAIIPRPDVLTLAVGRVRTLPRWDGTSFAPRRVVDLTLSVDHRALDGAAAARFLSTLEGILADPVAEGLA